MINPSNSPTSWTGVIFCRFSHSGRDGQIGFRISIETKELDGQAKPSSFQGIVILRSVNTGIIISR